MEKYLTLEGAAIDVYGFKFVVLIVINQDGSTMVLHTNMLANGILLILLLNTNATALSSDVVGLAFERMELFYVYTNGTLTANLATNITTFKTTLSNWFVAKGQYSSSGTSSGQTYNFGQNPTFSGTTTAGTYTDSNGKGLFKYQPPAGFLAMCEDNLPTPTIADPGEHFKTVLWTGDGRSFRSITGVGFQPDFGLDKNAVNSNHQFN